MHIDQEDQLISFDVTIDIEVTRIFTQASVDDALQILKEKLGDQTLEERTSIPVAQVMHLTELCLHSTYFQFLNHVLRTNGWSSYGLTPFAHHRQFVHGT